MPVGRAITLLSRSLDSVSEHAPGWYPVDGGQLRWYDGKEWTEHFAPAQDPRAASRGAVASAASTAVGRFTKGASGELPADTIWSAVVKPISGVGGGRYWLTPSYLFFERGTLTTDSQQIPVSAVVDVDVAQSLTQKARGVFSLTIHVNRGGRTELVLLADITDGRAGQHAINQAAHAARLSIQNAQQRQTIRYEGGLAHSTYQHPQQPAAQPAATADKAPDLVEQLSRLGALRDAGILTEEEFAAKKAEILSRL